MMRPIIALLGLALILLSTQLGSVHAASACDEIWVDADDISIGRNETEYFYFPVHNDYDEDFTVYEALVYRETGKFEISMVDYPDVIEAGGSGELTIKVKTESLDEESYGDAFVKLRGEFDDGTYCTFGRIGDTFFDVTVEMGDEEPECGDVELSVFNVIINEDSAKTVSFSIRNRSDEDFDLYDIEVDEESSYFDAGLYSKPSEVRAGRTESFKVRIEADSVNRDREGNVTVRAKGRFGNGDYCSYSSVPEEDFTVFVKNRTGGSTEPQDEGCESLYLNAATVRVERGGTGYATIFLENDSDEKFLIDYVSVFDSSPGFKAEEKGYEKTVPAFGSSYVNVAVTAYDYAEEGRYEAFAEVKGRFQNGESCHISGGTAAFDVVVEAPEAVPEPVPASSCGYFSLIVPETKVIGKAGTVAITIDNRSMERATVRLSGPGLTVQPKLISVPRNTLVTENVSVSSVLGETSLVYSIEALGCSKTESTKIFASVEPGPEAEPEQQDAMDEISSGLVALGQAGAVLGLVTIIGLVIYFILKP